VKTLTPYARFVEGQVRRGRTPPGTRVTLPPSRLMGSRHTIYEHPITHKFALIRLPARFAEGDPVPLRPTDRWFDTPDGPVAILAELLNEEED
jgi:hypothetical protein